MRSLYLLILITILCSPVDAATPPLTSQRLPAPAVLADDSAYYQWRGNQLYLLPLYGVCDANHAHACVQYSYLAAHLAFRRVGQPLTVGALASITYHGELSLFNGSAVSIEALGRSLLDQQSGACRYVPRVFHCMYTQVVGYLYTLQHWRDSVVMEGDYVRVNVRRLLGVAIADMGTSTRGYLHWTRVADAIEDNVDVWRSGMGRNTPSSWGNITGNVPPPGAYEWILIERGDCFHVAFIVSTRGRLPNSELGVCG